MHYTPFGKEAVSAEQIGLYFYKDGEKPELMMRETPLVDQFIKIPANDPAHKEIAYFNFPKDAILHTAVVHAHYRGTYSKLEVIDPDGKRETILNVPFYDFNWQRMYEFDQADQDPGRLESDRDLHLRQLEAEPGQPGSEQGNRVGRPVVRGNVLHLAALSLGRRDRREADEL